MKRILMVETYVNCRKLSNHLTAIATNVITSVYILLSSIVRAYSLEPDRFGFKSQLPQGLNSEFQQVTSLNLSDSIWKGGQVMSVMCLTQTCSLCLQLLVARTVVV